MKLFLIAGKARSGKTYVAHTLKGILDENGEKSVITEYSKYVKLFAQELLGWDGQSEPKPREFLQTMGSYMREKYGYTFFTDRMKEDIAIYERFVDNVIISDVRMPKEISEMASFHPITIQVINDYANYDLNEKESNHETEHALDEYKLFDYKIKNKNKEEVKKILESIVERF